MQMQRKRTYLGLGLLLFLGFFFIGSVLNFPSDRLTEVAQASLERATGWHWEIEPVKIRWNGIGTRSMQAWSKQGQGQKPLLLLERVNLSLLESLFGGPLLRLRTGKKGRIRLRLPWQLSGEGHLKLRVPLAELVIWQALLEQGFGEAIVMGELKAEAKISWHDAVPQGWLVASLSTLKVEGLKVSGFVLPTTEFELIELRVEAEEALQVRELRIKGDWEGDVSGSIKWNAKSPKSSVLNLQTQLIPRQSWLAELGLIRPLLESYLKQGQLLLKLKGSLANPRVST